MQRLLSAPALWIALGLAWLGLGLMADAGPRAPLHMADLPLYAALVIGLWQLRAGRPLYLPLSRRAAPWAFVALSWAFGMVYEASLTVTGTGIGGVHPETRASYILAQGDYLMIALATLLLTRFLRLDFDRAFFLAGGKSLTEGLIFTGVLAALVTTPQAWAAPLVLAYYMLAYATFVAMPLLFVDPRALWAVNRPAPLPIWLCWVIGFGVAFAIRLAWGLGWAPLATWLFGLPPNPL